MTIHLTDRCMRNMRIIAGIMTTIGSLLEGRITTGTIQPHIITTGTIRPLTHITQHIITLNPFITPPLFITARQSRIMIGSIPGGLQMSTDLAA